MICGWGVRVFLASALMSFYPALAQQVAATQSQIEGKIRDSSTKPLSGVSILLQTPGLPALPAAQSNADGNFRFSGITAGSYTIRLTKPGFRELDAVVAVSSAEKKHCDFVLQRSEELSMTASSDATSVGTIKLDDRPSFTVAGITDATASGGHGSETRMRTGEALAKETANLSSNEGASMLGATLKDRTSSGVQVSEESLRDALAKAPQSFEANHQLGEFYLNLSRYRDALPPLLAASQVNPGDYKNSYDLATAYLMLGDLPHASELGAQMLTHQRTNQEQASVRHLLGDLAERRHDPLEAVSDYQIAATLDPTESNYFSWGAELLLHKAAEPAVEVFRTGVRLHPTSARMLAGMGAALYAGGSAEEAARRLCDASDLEPASSIPYLFLGKLQEASPAALPCAGQTLERFARNNPENALANYYYGLALWKESRESGDPKTLQTIEALWKKSVAIDPRLSTAYVQLGNLYSSSGRFQDAIFAYKQAIAADPSGSDVHYRLGLSYKRVGDEQEAQKEFQQYKELDKSESTKVEKQRRDLRQFIITLREPASQSEPNAQSVSK